MPSPEEQAAIDEACLLAQIAVGDRAAFRALYARYSRPLFSLAVRMTGDPGAAEELLQDVFLKIWRSAARFDARKSRPFTWAITITRRTCIDHLRRHRREPPAVSLGETTGLVDLPAPDSVRQSAEASEDASRLRAALADLPVSQRHVLELALFSHFSHTEIAAQVGEPVGTVKTWIRRGLLALRATLNPLAS